MKSSTRTAIKAIIDTDSTIEPKHRKTLLAALRNYDSAKREMINRPAVCKILGISRDSVRRLVQQGVINRVEITSRLHRYDLEQIQRLASEGYRATP